jgi:hypothetical protein
VIRVKPPVPKVARGMDYQVIEGCALHNLGEGYRAIG